MPGIPTLATFEKQAALWAELKGVTLTRSEKRRLAERLREEWIAEIGVLEPDPDRDTRVLGILPDPTPAEAFHEITQNDRNAARRLGLVPA